MSITKLWIGILTSSLFLAFGCKSKKDSNNDGNLAMAPIEVKTKSLGNNDSVKSISYSSTVGASKAIVLSFQVSGTVLRIPVEVGQYVKKGQLIAEVDEAVYRNQYQAQLAQANLAKENYQRVLTVFNKGSIAEIKMLDAKASYEQATAAAKAVYQNIPHCKLYAPQSGYIGAKKIEAGSTAGPGIPVVELLDINVVSIHVPIPESEINNYKKDDKAKAVFPALNNATFDGTVDKISVASATGNPLYTVDVNVNNSSMQLKPGMSCNVFFDRKNHISSTATNQPIVVPDEAVQVDENGTYFVFVADNNHAKRKNVSIGKTYDNGIGINSGLESTDQLIVSGFHKITDGTSIKIIQ